MTMRLAYVGLGAMGSEVVKRLPAAGALRAVCDGPDPRMAGLPG